MFRKIKHSRSFSVAVLLVVAIVVLAACASQPAAPAAQAAIPAVAAPAQTTIVSADANTSSSTQAAPGGSNPAAPAKGSVSFSKELAPMIQDSCVSCHGGEKTSKGLDLKTFASLMAGSQNGPVVVAGDPAKSKLVQSVQSGKMPKRGAKWTAEQIQLLVDWVNAGAQNN